MQILLTREIQRKPLEQNPGHAKSPGRGYQPYVATFQKSTETPQRVRGKREAAADSSAIISLCIHMFFSVAVMFLFTRLYIIYLVQFLLIPWRAVVTR